MDLKKIWLIQILYDGLDYPTKTITESLCNRAFTSKIANDAWVLFEEVAKNALEWIPVTVDIKQPTIVTTTTNKGGMHRANLTLRMMLK